MYNKEDSHIITKKVIKVFASHLGFDDPRDVLKDMLLEDDLLMEEDELFEIYEELEEVFDIDLPFEVTCTFKKINDVIKFVLKST